MSVNQSGLRRTVGKNEVDDVPKGIRTADLIAGAFFLGLNVISLLGEVTNVFAKFGRPNSGISFLYKTLCYPSAMFVSHFITLKGDNVYVWMMAQAVFIISAFILWLVVVIVRWLFKAIFF